ncbi:MAG TPA: ParB/RepB/Spo0J family partition protein [Bacillota bacterium]|jgi:ParB family chromosome partitioning protein|nr:ParB/RepB/Spo0J family partition protein [Bacillota bacterium]
MNPSKNRGLGKGLEALFADVEIDVGNEKNKTNKNNEGVSFVDINMIKPSGYQPRKTFGEDKIDELAKSIEAHGIIQPIVIRKAGAGYEIVAGERRWRAARKAGLKDVPCLIREFTDEQNALVSLIENMQREDLNAMEEAAGLERMIAIFGLTQEQVSKSIGKSRPYIANSLRLLKLPGSIQEMVAEGQLSSGHARAIVGIKDSGAQLKAAEKCIQSNWTVRDIEAYAREYQKPAEKRKTKTRPKNRDVLALEEALRDIFGTKVNIVLGSKKGRIELEFYSRSELERLLELLQSIR